MEDVVVVWSLEMGQHWMAHLWDNVAVWALFHEVDQLYETDQWPTYYDLPPQMAQPVRVRTDAPAR